ncbi:MAG TPA: hypothetical protein VGF55_26720, partial [Gemmataceae bacterium]
RTIDNPVVSWADRAHVTDATQTSNRGVAWEYIAELANVSHKDIWINVPVGATDDYVRQLATLFKNLLAPDRAVYIELSNEMWNGNYSETGANKDAAVAEVAAGMASGHASNLMLPGETGKNADGTWTYQWEWAFRRQARRTKEISDIFASVWGADAINGRVRVVLASQIVNGYIPQTQLSWLNQTFGAPSKYLYALAGAPYFYVGSADQQTNLTADQVLSALSASIDANAKYVQDYSRWAAAYGLKLVAYEGGPDTFGPNNVAAKKAASLDPRMKDLTVKALSQWFGAGGGVMNWYVAGPTDYDTQYGAWGTTNSLDNLNAPKMQGIRQVAANPVDATAGFAAPGTLAAISYVGSTSTDPYPRYLKNGQTLDYLVRSPADGHYTLTVNYAAVSGGGQLRVWVNGTAVQTLTLPVTGPGYDSQWSPNSFADAQAIPLDLRAGENDVRLEVVSAGYTVNALKFTGASQPGTPAPPVMVVPPPTPVADTPEPAPVLVTGPVSSGISYVRGFSTTGLARNGYAAVVNGRLRLTGGGLQRGSAFFATPVGVGRFSTAFDFQSNNGSGEGLAFVLQGVGPTALGSGGGGLGYGGIASSAAVLFDSSGDAGVGKNMIGVAVNGGTPVGASLDLTAAGIDLGGGHELRAVVTYDAGVLSVSVADVTTGRTAQLKVPLDLVKVIGGTAAYAGFTAATNGLSSTQDVLDWTFSTVPDGRPMPKGVLARRSGSLHFPHVPRPVRRHNQGTVVHIPPADERTRPCPAPFTSRSTPPTRTEPWRSTAPCSAGSSRNGTAPRTTGSSAPARTASRASTAACSAVTARPRSKISRSTRSSARWTCRIRTSSSARRRRPAAPWRCRRCRSPASAGWPTSRTRRGTSSA